MLIEAIIVIGAMSLVMCAFAAAEPRIYRPKPTEEILYNPHMGFQTFQHFNGDPLFGGQRWTEVGPEDFGKKPKSLQNEDHPFTTVSYCRWYWDTIEPEDGVYRWEIIDGALKTARERGQTLAIRVMCHDHAGEHEAPEWFKKTGAAGGRREAKGGKYWLPDYEDRLYIKYWTRLNERLAERYDGHPDLETVDCASIGPWGEWNVRPQNPAMWAKAALIDCYTENFKKTPLLMQFDDAPSMRHGAERGTGWRADCLGDMGGFREGWSHMEDAYPQGIIYGGAADVWKKAPVAFEVCWVMGYWHDKGWDAGYIFDEAVKWHMTYFNTKSSPVSADQWDAVEKCLKRMGYRFVLRKLATTPKVRGGGQMEFRTWWENRGCAPIYRGYDVALQLVKDGKKVTMKTDADITKWLPGDSLYDGSVFVPFDVEPGKYMLRVGLLDRWTGEARVQLAQEGRAKDGWYELGKVEVVKNCAEVGRLSLPGTP